MLTIGHSTLPIDVFLHVLADNNVRVLVDIRTIPKSRHNPQFNWNRLSQHCIRFTFITITCRYGWL